MFRGSDYEFRHLTEFLDNGHVPVGYATPENKNRLFDLTRMYSVPLADRIASLVTEEDFSNNTVIGVFTDTLSGAAVIDEILPKLNLKEGGHLSIDIKWKMQDKGKNQTEWLEGQRFILIASDHPLPDFTLRMNYDALPLDDVSRDSATTLIPPFIMPVRTKMLTSDRKLSGWFSTKPVR